MNSFRIDTVPKEGHTGLEKPTFRLIHVHPMLQQVLQYLHEVLHMLFISPPCDDYIINVAGHTLSSLEYGIHGPLEHCRS